MSIGLRLLLRAMIYAIVAVTLGAGILGYSADRKLKVVRVSLDRDIVNITGELEGKSASLMCLKTIPECVVPEPRIYLLVQASPEMSAYNDCLNVFLYSYDTGTRGQKVGLYCLVSPEIE
jgi:hypothetical protein